MVRSLTLAGVTIPLRKITLGEEVEIERGGSPRPIDAYLTDEPDGLSWIKIGDAPSDGNRITSTKQKIKPSGLSKTRQVRTGDLILSNSMSFGRPYLLEIDGCIHDGWLSIKNSKGTFDITYLLYLLSSEAIKKQYQSLAGAGVVTNLNKELVSRVVAHIPDIQTQKIIGETLTVIDKKLTLKEKQLTTLKTLKKRLLTIFFTGQINNLNFKSWTKKKLKEVVSPSGGHTPSMNDESFWNSGSNIWLTSKDVKSDYLLDSEIKVSDKALQNLKQYPANNMVLVARSGILKHSLPLALVRVPFTINQDLKVLQVRHENPEFIFFALKAKTERILKNFVKSGTTVQSLMIPELMQMEIEIPKKEAQDQIANFFLLIDKKIQTQQAKLVSLKRLKQALMQQMFV